MKKILFFALMASFVMTAAAQITEGAPSAKKYATGNRPMKGTFGLYFGVESDLFGGNLHTASGFMNNPFPIVNLKYMATDNFEVRLGMKFWKQRESLRFGNDETDEDAVTGAALVQEKYSGKYVDADNQFRPGFAYHFTKSNLLDVYAGLEGIIGWHRGVQKYWTSLDGDEVTNNVRTSSVQFGAGAFIGLQAFIARLPFAIGFEYGISTKWDGGLKTRTYYKDEDTSYTVYNVDAAQLPNLAANLPALVGQAGQRTDVC